MPHFEEFYANKLRGSLGVAEAESVLDLRGAGREQAAASLQDGESVEYDLASGRLVRQDGSVLQLPPAPAFLREALAEGSILEFFKRHRRFPGE